MKFATWNINSIRARLQRLLLWLEREQPDVLCLQEIKATDEQFPRKAIQDAGFHAAVFGQKAYNGVVILSRAEPQRVERAMGKEPSDSPARLITAEIDGIRCLSAYFPNGRTVRSEEYQGKLEWMEQLRRYLDTSSSPRDPLILAGDFNVAPRDDDVANPARWGGSVLCHPDAREALERIRAWGLVDVLRQHHPEGGIYSWWDYQMLGFPKNDGLRIDHVFATEPLARCSAAAWVDRNERKKGEVDKPSDHAPVIAEFDI